MDKKSKLKKVAANDNNIGGNSHGTAIIRAKIECILMWGVWSLFLALTDYTSVLILFFVFKKHKTD